MQKNKYNKIEKVQLLGQNFIWCVFTTDILQTYHIHYKQNILYKSPTYTYNFHTVIEDTLTQMILAAIVHKFESNLSLQEGK